MTDLRQYARGKPCQIRLPGICNYESESTVLAHFRLIGMSGMGRKSPDLIGSWACSKCHTFVDTHHDAETQLAFAHGVFRTQFLLIEDEVVIT